jgi:CheY-like chemotaxis protein
MNKDYSGYKILVVDDTAMNRRLAEILLKKQGFAVTTTDSGIDAVRRVKEAKAGDVDLILMDVRMPVMDGLEATRRIRALEDNELSGIPVIAMTANAFEADINEALGAGMDSYVPKPFTPEELIRVIDRHIRK